MIVENVTTANNENELCFDRVKRGWEDVAGKEKSTNRVGGIRGCITEARQF